MGSCPLAASASKSALVLSPCLRWAGEGIKEYDDKYTDTTKRDFGTLFHSAMEKYYNEGEKWLKVCCHDDICTENVRLAIEWSRAFLEPRCESIATEVYVAYNFATGEVHTDPTVRNRKYPKKPGFLPGTADLVCILRDGSLLVGDWKTGGGTGADKQLLSLASGLSKVYRTSAGLLRPVVLSLLYATGDGVHPVEWAITEGDLLAHEHAMAERLAIVGTKEANEPHVSIHCSQLYCNHLAHCPGVKAVVESLSESPKALLLPESLVRKSKGMTLTDMPISDDEAGYVMERLAAAKRQMQYLENCMRDYINSGGKAVSGDLEFKKTNSGFRWVKRV